MGWKRDLIYLCANIGKEITEIDLEKMKYLLKDKIHARPLEQCHNVNDIFIKLYQMGSINDSQIGLIFQILELIEQQSLIKVIEKSEFYKNHPDCRSFTQYDEPISAHRILLYSVAAKLRKADFEQLKFLWRDQLSAQMMDSKSVWTIFRTLEQRGVISEDNLMKSPGLCEKLNLMGRDDLVELISKNTSQKPSDGQLACGIEEEGKMDYTCSDDSL